MKKISLFLGMLILLSSFVSGALSDNIWGAWKFDGDVEYAANAGGWEWINHGTSNVAGINGTALFFNATELDFAYTTNNTPRPANFTINLWVNFSNDIISHQKIFSKWYDWATRGIELVVSPTGYEEQIVFVYSATGADTTLLVFPDKVNIGKWYMVTVRFDNTSSDLDLFVNGTQVNTTTTTINRNSANWSLGRPNYIPAYYLKGTIDEFTIWNDVKTDAEILELYNNGKGLFYPFSDTTTPYTIILNKLDEINTKIEKLELGIKEINQTTKTTETSASLILDLIGKVFNRTITLFQGWNLASSPYPVEKTIEQSTDSIKGCYRHIFAYNKTKWLSYDVLKPVPLNTLNIIYPNFGYWVRVNCTQVDWDA